MKHFYDLNANKEHKGSQHSIKEFKIDVKKMKAEISNMVTIIT